MRQGTRRREADGTERAGFALGRVYAPGIPNRTMNPNVTLDCGSLLFPLPTSPRAVVQSSASRCSIPKGLRPPAQGCRVREATLGKSGKMSSTPTGLRRASRFGSQPRWGCFHSNRIPRVARSSQPWALSRNPVGIQSCGAADVGNDKSLLPLWRRAACCPWRGVLANPFLTTCGRPQPPQSGSRLPQSKGSASVIP